MRRNYAHVLVLLLRLRQICSHTSLITELDGVIADEDYDKTNESHAEQLARAESLVSRDFVLKMQTKFKELAIQRIEAEQQVCYIYAPQHASYLLLYDVSLQKQW